MGADCALAPSIDRASFNAYFPRSSFTATGPPRDNESGPMKVKNSLKSAKQRHRECRVVRRRGRVYVINKRNPRFKTKQG